MQRSESNRVVAAPNAEHGRRRLNDLGSAHDADRRVCVHFGVADLDVDRLEVIEQDPRDGPPVAIRNVDVQLDFVPVGVRDVQAASGPVACSGRDRDTACPQRRHSITELTVGCCSDGSFCDDR